MENIALGTHHFSNPRADYAIAAAQFCFLKYGDEDPVRISRLVSQAMKRPVLVVNLSLLPHRPDASKDNSVLSAGEIEHHAAIFKDLAGKAFAEGQGFPPSWNWNDCGHLHTVSSYPLCGNETMPKEMPSRMHGEFWVQAAVVTTADSRASRRVVWSRIAGLSAEDIEHCPSSDAAVRAYNAGHELGHVQQLCTHRFIPDEEWRWKTERGADQASFAGFTLLSQKKMGSRMGGGKIAFRKEELEDVAQGVIHGRATAAFRASCPLYWSALNLNGVQATYQQSLLCNYELRLRVYAEMNDIPLPRSSEKVQEQISQWKNGAQNPLSKTLEKAFGDDWDWGHFNDIDRAIPVLNRILRRGDITDLRASVNAELVIDAATYFKPSLWPKLHMPPVMEQPVARVRALTPMQLACKPG